MNKEMDIEVKLLYVDEFIPKIAHPETVPEAGQIYRAIKRQAPAMGDFYQLLYDNPKDDYNLGIFLPKLKVNNPFFKCKMREVTLEDVLELDIDEGVFEKISRWGVDFKDGLNDSLLNIPIINEIDNAIEIPTDEFINKLSEKLMDVIDDKMAKVKYKGRSGNALDGLIDADIEFGKTVEELVEYFLSTYDEKYVKSPIGNPSIEILYSAEHGKGVNIFNALKYIQRYMSEGFSKSDNPQDVVKAIHYLIFELTRLNKHASK